MRETTMAVIAAIPNGSDSGHVLAFCTDPVFAESVCGAFNDASPDGMQIVWTDMKVRFQIVGDENVLVVDTSHDED